MCLEYLIGLCINGSVLSADFKHGKNQPDCDTVFRTCLSFACVDLMRDVLVRAFRIPTLYVSTIYQPINYIGMIP